MDSKMPTVKFVVQTTPHTKKCPRKNKGVQVAEPTVSSPHRRCNRPLLPPLEDTPVPNPTAATKPAPPPPTPNKDVPQGFTTVRWRKKKVRCTSLFASHNVFSVLQGRTAARAQDSPYRHPPAKTKETSSEVTSPPKRSQYLCRPTPPHPMYQQQPKFVQEFVIFESV